MIRQGEPNILGLDLLLLLIGLAFILVSAELFTNAVEWLGLQLGVNEGVVGSVFAAVGTALPETLIPIVAVLVSDGEDQGSDIGVGAILGAPFMLATLAMFVAGLAVLAFHRTNGRSLTLSIDRSVLRRDVSYFLMAYVGAIGLALFDLKPLRWVAALGLVLFYGYYVYRHAREEQSTHSLEGEIEGRKAEQARTEELGALRFQPRAARPAMGMIALQLLVSLGVMMGCAFLFVQQITALAESFGLPALLLSLLIAPVATELPEQLNSVLWIRRGKDTLALGNITGAMVFQSCFPVSFGLLFTEWSVTAESFGGFISGVMALGSAGILFMALRTNKALHVASLLIGGAFYAAYVGYLLLTVG
jgi:cation:H+ antiporter